MKYFYTFLINISRKPKSITLVNLVESCSKIWWQMCICTYLRMYECSGARNTKFLQFNFVNSSRQASYDLGHMVIGCSIVNLYMYVKESMI